MPTPEEADQPHNVIAPRACVPAAISANTTYVASYHTNVGRYVDDQNYFTGSGVDNPPLHTLADGVDGGNGVYLYASASAFPVNSYVASNYWVDVVFHP